MKLAIHDESVLPLAAAIVAQAVDDFKEFQRRGIIEGGRAKQKSGCHGATEYKEARSLIYFFSPLGAIEDLLALTGFKISATQIRNKLGII